MTTTLRAIKKLPFDNIKLPKVSLPASSSAPAMVWGGNSPAPKGFERFYNPHIQSVLTLPSHWFSYESEYTNGGIPTKLVISSVEDAAHDGVYNTGVALTCFDLSNLLPASSANAPKREHAFPIADMIRQKTMKQIQTPLGGSTDWRQYGDSLHICSLRYAAKVPKMFATRPGDSEGIRYQELAAKEMVFIQDIVCERERGIVFVMMFETPKQDFESANFQGSKDTSIEETFRTIKTSSYFAFRAESSKNSRGEMREMGDDGFVFLQL
jgi:hypothetical protein